MSFLRQLLCTTLNHLFSSLNNFLRPFPGVCLRRGSGLLMLCLWIQVIVTMDNPCRPVDLFSDKQVYIVMCQAHLALVKKANQMCGSFLIRIPGPVSCRCPSGSLETPPRWHATRQFTFYIILISDESCIKKI